MIGEDGGVGTPEKEADAEAGTETGSDGDARTSEG